MASTKQNVSTEELSTFGARLRHEREAQNLSRPALAAMADGILSARMIDHLENGTTEVTGQRIELLSKVLNVDRNWLGFGDKNAQNTLSDNSASMDTGTTPGNDETRRGIKPVDHPGSNVNTGLHRSGRSVIPENTGGTGATDATEDTGCDQSEPAIDDPTHMYVEEMVGVLAHIDLLREDGLQKHPRKMPRLLEQARDIGGCLETSDLQELALDRGVDPELFKTEDLSEEAFDEFILRLIDTAVLGIDLYALDKDTLKSFAQKHDIARPFFGWDSVGELISDVRDTYWHKALEGNIKLTVSLRQSV